MNLLIDPIAPVHGRLDADPPQLHDDQARIDKALGVLAKGHPASIEHVDRDREDQRGEDVVQCAPFAGDVFGQPRAKQAASGAPCKETIASLQSTRPEKA